MTDEEREQREPQTTCSCRLFLLIRPAISPRGFNPAGDFTGWIGRSPRVD